MIRLVRPRLRFRGEADYEAFVDAAEQCAGCQRYEQPRLLHGCECGDGWCDSCHEQRTCCGENETLNQALTRLGFKAEPADRPRQKDIVNRETGELVFTGDAGDVWEWLLARSEGTPFPCPHCGERPTAERNFGWSVCCTNCYDGAPDAGPQLMGVGLKASAAVFAWNEQIAEGAQ